MEDWGGKDDEKVEDDQEGVEDEEEAKREYKN